MAVQFYDGKVLFVGGAVAMHADCCCSDDAPCTCPAGLTGDYRLVSYTDGDLTGCVDCEDSTGAAWAGVFKYASSCSWERPGDLYSIDGKVLAISRIILDTTGDPDCKWTLLIECANPLVLETIWYGTKDTGQDPTGVYTRVSGCDATASLSVEAVP